MIPKVIHYCWFGGKPLPESAKKCIESWKKFFPDYEIKRWDESNFDVNAIKYTREAYWLKKYAFVSDYARIWILYHYGGLYFDTDVEVIKSMDDIVERGPFMGMEAGPQTKSVSGFAPGLGLGAEQGDKLYKEILDWYEHNHFATWNGKMKKTIVSVVTDLMNKKPVEKLPNGILKIDAIFIYPPEYFCPQNYYTGELNITDNTRSIHHYSASWTTKTKTLSQKILKRYRFMRAHFNLYLK